MHNVMVVLAYVVALVLQLAFRIFMALICSISGGNYDGNYLVWCGPLPNWVRIAATPTWKVILDEVTFEPYYRAKYSPAEDQPVAHQ